MNEQTFIILLSIAGSIILLLIGVLGYFLKQNVALLKELNISFQTFREDYATTKERVVNLQGNCKEKHDTINVRLNEHGKRLDNHEKDIEVLKHQVN